MKVNDFIRVEPMIMITLRNQHGWDKQYQHELMSQITRSSPHVKCIITVPTPVTTPAHMPPLIVGLWDCRGDHTLVQRSTNIFTDFHRKYFHLSCKTSHQTVVSSYITVWLMFTGDILMTASVRTTPSSSPQSSTYYTITLHHTAPQYTMWQYWSSCSSNDALCLC